MASLRYRYIVSCIVISGLLAGWSHAADSTVTKPAPTESRQRLLMDFDWRFAFGHPSDTQNDFNHATGFFSYLAKAGYGDGPAAANFNDSTWRKLNLPHDWAVEVPFDGNGSHSHGYKAVGRKFPEASIGWYRKVFAIPDADLGRRISIEFDGIFRDSMVWINGHYLGRQPSGYTSFRYDITPYLRYGENNTIAVRVDATMEEGWFYEGAGIYRHVWLVKTDPLHVAPYGTFVQTETKDTLTLVTMQTTVVNENESGRTFEIGQTILDADGKSVATQQVKNLSLAAGGMADFPCTLTVNTPKLWSLESPYLYKLVTTIQSEGKTVDRYETPFGIRTIHFDPAKGFFLNGNSVKLKGTNNHQDHAGVGAAIPDALQEFRIARLKDMGSNAYRCSHNPPTPELLDACDRLGMLVIDENRLMGISPEIQEQVKAMILRDRNHPSVILWSLGNEEWAIEGNITGARIASEMQAFTQRLDPTRRTTIAISGGWGYGISTVLDVMGYNYISHGSTDQQHAKFPNQPGVGTEETTTQGTRGIYFDDRPNAHMAALESGNSGGNCEIGWKHYADRPYLAGLFYWTGFDYRGEPTPFNFPAISTQCGILDTCGFPKDSFYYLKSWWTEQPVLHLSPHWTWPGKEGQELTLRCDSNCDEVELFCNDKSLGKKRMEANSHLEWKAVYQPGTLLARGYKNGKEVVITHVETTGPAAAIMLTPFRNTIKADAEDVTVVTVQVNDAQGRMVPTADNDITFAIQGPANIIGVGNGNPSSHEPDVFVTKWPMRSTAVKGWTWKKVLDARRKDLAEIAADFDDSGWTQHNIRSENGPLAWGEHGVFRSTVTVSESDLAVDKIMLTFGCIDQEGWIYVNGQEAGQSLDWRAAPSFDVKRFLRPGTNSIAVAVANIDGQGGINKGASLLFQEKPILPTWKRKTFNGLAQVILQSTPQPGDITLTATAEGLKPAVLKIPAQSATPRPSVPVK
ncbi:MAG: beta-galactosidase GalA [Anaerohalosphaeraceae bacterium]